MGCPTARLMPNGPKTYGLAIILEIELHRCTVAIEQITADEGPLSHNLARREVRAWIAF